MVPKKLLECYNSHCILYALEMVKKKKKTERNQTLRLISLSHRYYLKVCYD